MRLSLHFKINDPVIPLDYRRGFLSLLMRSFELIAKETYKDLYNSLYGMNRLKPFTFAVYFGNKAKIAEEKVFINSDSIILNFSTSSYELGEYLQNGLLKVKKEIGTGSV